MVPREVLQIRPSFLLMVLVEHFGENTSHRDRETTEAPGFSRRSSQPHSYGHPPVESASPSALNVARDRSAHRVRETHLAREGLKAANTRYLVAFPL